MSFNGVGNPVKVLGGIGGLYRVSCLSDGKTEIIARCSSGIGGLYRVSCRTGARGSSG